MNISSVDICNMALIRIGQGLISSLDDDSPQAKFCKAIYDLNLRSLQSKYVWNFLRKSKKLDLAFSTDHYNDTIDRYDARIADPNNADIKNNLEASKQNYINEYSKYYYPYKNIYSLPEDFLTLVDLTHGGQSLLSLNCEKPAYDFHTYIFINVTEQDTGTDLLNTTQTYGLVSDYDPLCLHYVGYNNDVRAFPIGFIDCLVLDIAINLTVNLNYNLQLYQGLVALYEDTLSKAKISECQQTIISYSR